MASDSDTDIINAKEDLDLRVNMAVLEALPNLTASKKQSVMKKLDELGVEEAGDLSFLKAEDFHEVLTPIEARKAISTWQSHSTGGLVLPSLDGMSSVPSLSGSQLSLFSEASSLQPSQKGETSTSVLEEEEPKTSRPKSLALADVDWDNAPKRVKKLLNKGAKLPPPERLDLVRFIVDSLESDHGTYPRTEKLRIVAIEAVSKYPKSLMDIYVGDKVGHGYDSLLTQLVNRVDNLSRPSASQSQTSLKRKLSEDGTKNARKIQMDSYGCARWQPAELPDGQTPESQKCIMDKLKEKFREDEGFDESVEADMMTTYATQRQHINTEQGLSFVKATKENWPYLFKPKYCMNHLNNLLDFNSTDKMKESYERKIPKLMRFLADNKKCKQVLEDIEKAKEKTEDDTPNVFGALFALGAYFGEDLKKNIMPMNEEVEVHKLEDRDLPELPCLVTHGQPLTACLFTLMIDREEAVVITNVLDALVIWFGSFYIFNLHYPAVCSNVLEFVQRVLLGINPDRGSKKPRQGGGKGKKTKISAKVLNLTNQLQNYENEWNLAV